MRTAENKFSEITDPFWKSFRRKAVARDPVFSTAHPKKEAGRPPRYFELRMGISGLLFAVCVNLKSPGLNCAFKSLPEKKARRFIALFLRKKLKLNPVSQRV